MQHFGHKVFPANLPTSTRYPPSETKEEATYHNQTVAVVDKFRIGHKYSKTQRTGQSQRYLLT